jgi:hypothetical protein
MTRDEEKSELVAILLALDALVRTGKLPKVHPASPGEGVKERRRRGELNPQPPHQYPDLLRQPPSAIPMGSITSMQLDWPSLQ